MPPTIKAQRIRAIERSITGYCEDQGFRINGQKPWPRIEVMTDFDDLKMLDLDRLAERVCADVEL